MRRFVAALVTLVLLGAPAGHAAGQSLRWDGHWLLDPSGRHVLLHGLNVVYKRAPYLPDPGGNTITANSLNDSDAALIASMGYNVVRLGLIWKGLEPQRGTFDETYLATARQIVGVLGAHGIRTLLDFHQDVYNERYGGEGAPDWAVQSPLPATNTGNWGANYFTPAATNEMDLFWANANGIQDAFADAWAAVARAFASDENVLGYDIWNEPFPGSQTPTCASPAGCPLFDKDFLQPFYERVIPKIRAADPDHIVYWEPNVTANFGAGANVGPVAGTKLGMSFHVYCLPGSFDGSWTDSGTYCSNTDDIAFDNLSTKADLQGVHPLLTEFGANDDTVGLQAMLDRADNAMIGWIYWAYKQFDDPTGSAVEALVNDDGTVKAKGPLLARPYPRSVAGTLSSLDWNPVLGMLTVRYSATAGVTEISTPAIALPHGYAVVVTGPASVTSAPDAGILTLATTGTGVVTVKVTAGIP